MAKLIGSLIAAMEGDTVDLLEASSGSGESLNAGFELDAEDIFVTPLEPGEVPELRDDVDLIATLESRLMDLSFLVEDVRKVGGMSQEFALEAEKLLPGFGGVPVSFYSTQPTATRYKVALEEMSKGLWALIAAATAAILTAIYKAYAWFTGKKAPDDAAGASGGGGSSSTGHAEQEATAEEAMKVSEEMREDVKEMAKAMHLGDRAINKADRLLAHADLVLKNEHGKEYHVKSFQDIIDNIFTDEERFARAKRFLEGRDPVMHDIISNGEYSKLMVAMSDKMHAVNTVMTMKLNLLDGVIRKDLGSSDVGSAVKNTDFLKKTSAPVEVTVNGQLLTLAELANKLRTTRQELTEKNVHTPVMFDRMFTTMAHAYSSHQIDTIMVQQETLMKCINWLQGQVEKMQSVARNLSTDGVPGAMTQDVGQHLREVLFTVSKEVIAMVSIAAEIKLYFKNLQHVANQALGFGVEVVRKAAEQMRKDKQDVPEGWEAVLNDLRMQQKAITTAYYRRTRR